MLQAFQAIAVALGRSLDVEEVVRTTLDEIRQVLRIEAAGFYLLDPSTGTITLKASTGYSPAFAEQVRSLPLSQVPLTAEAIASQGPVTLPVNAHPNPALRTILREEGFRVVAGTPLLSRGRALGVLLLGRRAEEPFSPEELELLGAVGGVVGLALENATLYQELSAHRDRLRALSSGIMRAREEEARRIARELHDEAGQLLASVHLALEEVGRDLPPPHRERLPGIRDLLDRIEEELRRLSHELRPTILDDLGLVPALEWLIQGVSTRTGLPIALEGSTEGRLPPLIETALYRIVQEALTNVTKHARATRVMVRLRREASRIRCVIQDDGIGFDAPTVLARRGERGLGLIGIQERLFPLGGSLEITSSPGRGTALSITIPLET